MEELRKTPLYDRHVRLGGKMVPFAGYLLPVQYPAGVIAEHMAVRRSCGLFDVSHMGEVRLTGPDAVKNLNILLTNDYTEMQDGRARYSPMCSEEGGIIDDLIVYKERENQYVIVVNAANRAKDFAWISGHISGDAKAEDLSDRVAQLALQGPKAEEVLRKLVKEEDIPVKYYSACFNRDVSGVKCLISRTGYTGEDGFELYTKAENAGKLWDMLMEAGKEEGILPCGLGARDTLRLEAAMPLYGHEMDETVTPFEAGLGRFVKMEKPEFIGRNALSSGSTPERIRVGLAVTGRGIIRENEEVSDEAGSRIGRTTSGTFLPYLNRPAAMALLSTAYAEPGTAVLVSVRGKRIAAEVVPLPFYRKGQPAGERAQEEK